MKKKESIKNIMSDDMVTGNKNDLFSAIKKRMDEHKIHHIPIVEGHKLIGIVSRTDIHKFSHSRAFVDNGEVDHSLDVAVPVEKLMTRNPIALKDSDTIKHAVQILNKNTFNSIPVIKDENKELVGIVTSKDILTYLTQQY